MISFPSIVCVKTLNEFIDTYLQDDAIKSDPKAIEEAFKKYCLTAKSKQQRLVSGYRLALDRTDVAFD